MTQVSVIVSVCCSPSLHLLIKLQSFYEKSLSRYVLHIKQFESNRCVVPRVVVEGQRVLLFVIRESITVLFGQQIN